MFSLSQNFATFEKIIFFDFKNKTIIYCEFKINLAFKICKFRIISNLIIMVKAHVVMVPKDYNEYLQSAFEVHNDM